MTTVEPSIPLTCTWRIAEQILGEACFHELLKHRVHVHKEGASFGEVVKALPADLREAQPQIPWAQIAGMLDRLAHRYFDTSHAILAATVAQDLPELELAVDALIPQVDED